VCVCVTCFSLYRGEAWIKTSSPRYHSAGAGVKRHAQYDLGFAIEWVASVGHGAAHYTGRVRIEDLASENDPAEAYEVRIST